MKLFPDPDPRAVAVTVIAGVLLAADVLRNGFAPSGVDRIGESLELAKQFIARVESTTDR